MGNESNEKNRTIDIEGNGVFLSYQMLFLLISSLIGLGVSISVWNSYQNDIESNRNNIARLDKIINERYELLDNKIERKYEESLIKVEDRYNTMKNDVNQTSERYKEWLKNISQTADQNKENILILKYNKLDKSK